MCAGGGDGGAAEARAREAARAANIKSGMERINAIYDGGRYGEKLATGYDPNATYYTNTGEVWNPDMSEYTTYPGYLPYNARNGQMSGQKKEDYAVVDPMARYKAYQKAMAGNGTQLYSGFGTSGGFDDNFYKQRRQDYLDYAMPQLTQQYNDAYKNLVYGLTRTGGLNSSTGVEQRALLTRTMDERRRAVADEALNQENRLRGDVETQRTNLVSQLNQSADPAAISSSALNQAALLRSPTSFAPIGDAFQNITAMVAKNQQARLQNPEIPSIFGFDILNGEKGSSRNVR